MHVIEWIDDRVLADKPRFKRGTSGGSYYIWLEKGNGGWLAWNLRRFDAGVFEIVCRVSEGQVGGCIVNFVNKEAETGLCIVVNHQGRLGVRPSLFGKDASLAPTLAPFKYPAIKSAGEFNRLQLVMKRRSLDVYCDGERVCRTIECNFDLAPAMISLGIAGGGKQGSARVEYKRFAVWPTTDLDRIAPIAKSK